MYLWKYWRESRVTFLSSLLAAVLFFWLILNASFRDPTFAGGAGLALPLGFLAWRFGSFGIGRDRDEGSATYLFSRPRSRAFFVWHDWGFGMAQLALIVVALDLLTAVAGHLQHMPGMSKAVLPTSVSLAEIVALNCVADLLIVALIFGMTYFCTVLLKLKGLLASAGLLLWYPIGFVPIVRHYWPSIKLPSLVLAEFVRSSDGKIAGFADSIGISIVVRAAVALIFPCAAIWLLQKRDLD